MASVIIGGGHECPKCGSSDYKTIDSLMKGVVESGTGVRLKYRDNGFDYKCNKCGAKSKVYQKKKMVENLLRYGFVEIERYDKFLFYFNGRQLESIYEFDGVIASHIEDSVNMSFNMGGDAEIIFNNHGDYKFVVKHLDNIFNTKEFKRDRLLKELLEG